MSIRRYLVTVWIMVMAAILAVFAIAFDSSIASGWIWRVIVGVPITSALVALQLRRFAERTPPEARVNFWAYRSSNWMLAAIGAAMVWATLTVMI